MVYKISTFSRLSEIQKEQLKTNEELDSASRLKEGCPRFPELKDSNSLKETDKRAHAIGNVKLTIQSARIL